MGRPAEGYEGNYWGCWILLGAPVFIILLPIICEAKRLIPNWITARKRKNRLESPNSKEH